MQSSIPTVSRTVYRAVVRAVLLIVIAISVVWTGRFAAADALEAPISDASAGPAYVPYNEAHPVLAYYYGWWEAPVLQRGIHKSALGLGPGALPWEQVIDRPVVVREHIRQAQVAGVDGFIANRASDMARLLEIGQAYDFRSTVQVNAAAGMGAAEAELREFYRYADHPAMVRYQGRPVVFFWRATDTAQWAALRDRLDPNHVAVWLADGDNFNILRNPAFDGISPYQIAWSGTPETQLPGWGARARAVDAGKLYVPPIAPGCNDSPARAATCIQHRQDGAYYGRVLEGALASAPEWAVVVSTWNEWLEDTQIEPSVEYGDLYLRMTREFAETFKGGMAAVPPCC